MAIRKRTSIILCLLLVLLPISTSSLTEASSNEQFLILLTNDDGYDAPGLRAMAEALAPLGQVVVAAPIENQSGTGHSTTTRQFIRVRPIELIPGVAGHAVAARPATCVRLALESLVPRRPDLVISGINRGNNLGIVTYYSGTVGAAREAAIVGIPSIAVSMQGDEMEDYQATAAFVARLLEELRRQGRLRPGLLLNVNTPAGEHRGVRLTRQSTMAPPQIFKPYTPRRGYDYYWSGYRRLLEEEENTDVWAVRHGYVSLTPMQIDQTRAADFDWLRKLTLEAAPAPTR